MRDEVRDWLLLMGKSVLAVIGAILVVAALVDLVVAGWSLRTAAVLAVGLAMCVPPVAFAFRDALREARKGRI